MGQNSQELLYIQVYREEVDEVGGTIYAKISAARLIVCRAVVSGRYNRRIMVSSITPIIIIIGPNS